MFAFKGILALVALEAQQAPVPARQQRHLPPSAWSSCISSVDVCPPRADPARLAPWPRRPPPASAGARRGAGGTPSSPLERLFKTRLCSFFLGGKGLELPCPLADGLKKWWRSPPLAAAEDRLKHAGLLLPLCCLDTPAGRD